MYARDDRLVRWQIYLGFAALFVGLLMGLFQAIDRANIDVYSSVRPQSYWQGLTLHGVLNVLVFTFAFNAGFLTYVTSHSLERPMAVHALTQGQFWLMLVGGLAFMAGGISGLVNVSYNVNQIAHNTAFVPGHFHLTVGTAVTLSIMGSMYWLLPALTGRKLWGRRVAQANVWLWAVGVSIMSRGMSQAGIAGEPRRFYASAATYHLPDWDFSNLLQVLGATLMFFGGLCFFIVLVGTLFFSRERDETTTMPVAEVIVPAEKGAPIFTDRVGAWVGFAIALILISYGPFLVTYLSNPAFVAPGMRAW